MTIEQQKTFGPEFGLEPVVPVGPHPDDDIICEDGWICKRRDAFVDCKGGLHSNDDDRFDANVTIVTEFFDSVDEWVCEYATENEDYADGYAHIVDELSHDWPDRVEEWVRDNYGNYYGSVDFDLDAVVKSICDELDGCSECEVEYERSDYAAYSGSGCCLFSFDIGEVEEQTDINAHPVLKGLHDAGELDDILDHVKSDAYISRSRRRVKNEETGYYEPVGRETYDPYGSDYPDILSYHCPGGQWQFVVPADRMKELADAAICQIGSADSDDDDE